MLLDPHSPTPSPITPHDREKIMSEIELNSKRAGLHGFETVKVCLTQTRESRLT